MVKKIHVNNFICFHFPFSVEELVLTEFSEPQSGSWDNDYDKMILPVLADDQPCYILFRQVLYYIL